MKTGGYLDMAIDLAESGRGRTNPNPMVGAVVVKNGRVIGEGYHPRAGDSHAEIYALKEAGARAQGATLYVTLEPCCHLGRTGPCTETIIQSGIVNVVIGAIDPNPLVSGKGIEALEGAGLTVTISESERIPRQNEVYFKYITTRQPFTLLKIAVSLDGKIAAPVGARTNLTGARAQLEVHRLRNEYEAIMVGVDTVITDNPALNCRLEGSDVRQPLRIVLDSTGRLPVESRIVQTAEERPVILATTERIEKIKTRELTAQGVEILVCETNNRGRVDIADLKHRLAEREISSLMVESGAGLTVEMIVESLADKIMLFYAPVFIGDADSLSMTAGGYTLTQRWRTHECKLLGEDVMIELYPPGSTTGAAGGRGELTD